MATPATTTEAPAAGAAAAAAATTPAAAAPATVLAAPTSVVNTGGPAVGTILPDGLVMIGAEDCPEGTPIVAGYNFNADCKPRGGAGAPADAAPVAPAAPATPAAPTVAGAVAAAGGAAAIDYDALLASYATMGFQATNFALAVEEVNKMLRWRLSDDAILPAENEEWRDPAVRAATRCTIFLSFTSNQISCGQREIIHFLVKHKLVSCIVTTAGAVEEDIMKTLRPHYVGDFYLKGKDLRMRGINRTGNLLVPNLNYVALEDWFGPVLNRMHDEQVGRGAAKGKPKVIWSPSKIVQRIGEEMTDESSVWYWTARNGIPVFCPGLTDGAIGDMLYYHTYDREGFIVDVVQDVRRLNNIARRAKKSGMIILGGGIAKHHTCNANLMRNGADYVVYINTAHDFDGSDSGARPDEAVSWGKIRLTATPVKIYADATLVFPLLVARTFVKHVQAAQAAATAAGTPLDCAVAPAERADDPE